MLINYYFDCGIDSIKCNKPKMSNLNGRTWDFINGMIDGKEVKFYLDTSRGFYLYFEWCEQWYKTKINESIEFVDGIEVCNMAEHPRFLTPEFDASLCSESSIDLNA